MFKSEICNHSYALSCGNSVSNNREESVCELSQDWCPAGLEEILHNWSC